MATIFDKWNKSIDGEALKKDVQDAKENGGTRESVPFGVYEVKIEKIELKECGSDKHKGEPMGVVWFRILKGKFANSIIFANQLLSQGFQVHNFNELMRSLDTGIDVEFNGDWNDYNDVLLDIFEGTANLEYVLDYGQNSKGYSTYKITDVFEK